MAWKNVKLAPGSRLFKQHNFIYMHKGVTYSLELDEFNNETFTGHGESATDKNFMIEPVNGNSIEECLQKIITRINERS